MANIKISELRPAGFDLFQDSESFLNDLTDTDSMSVVGGEDKAYGNDSVYAYHAIVNIAVIHHLSFIAELVGSLASNVGGGNGGGK